MNPYEYWYQLWTWWAETLFEIRALRNCHNQNRDELTKIKELLIKEGIWK